MKRSFLFLAAFMLYVTAGAPELRPAEARSAFILLNKIRTHPAAFANRFPFLAELAPTHALKWNDTLARVAAKKALDMATRKYFAHVNPEGFGMNYFINKAGYKLPQAWLQKPAANYFESCNGGGRSGEEAITMLLIDDGVPSLGHRKHLLGLDEWSSTLVDVGIGYAWTGTTDPYVSYTCVLIAKHQ